MTKRIYSVKKDKVDLRDYIFSAQTIKDSVPASVDLRPRCSPIVDQDQLGSCTANAIASGLREYLELQDQIPFVELSRLYLYWHERELEGTLGEDSGAYPRDGMKVLKNLGVSPEVDFPYVISTYNDTPSAHAEAAAATYKIIQYFRVTNLKMLQASLAENFPVVIGFTVYSSFESAEVAQTGRVPMPQEGEEILGGHAVLAVGYDESQQVVICRNSWGKKWGEQGYFYLPYGFWYDNIVNDMWTGKTKK